MTADAEDQASDPLIWVVRGSPTDEELAAVLVVLTASSSSAPRPPSTASGWSAYWRSVGVAPQPGPDAWRMSGRRH